MGDPTSIASGREAGRLGRYRAMVSTNNTPGRASPTPAGSGPDRGGSAPAAAAETAGKEQGDAP